MLSVESVNNLGVSPPEAELVKLAIAHMQKVLEGIGRNLNYLEMYKERERLIAKIKVETEARGRVEAKQTETGHKIVLVDSILNLYAQYTSVTQELAKLSTPSNNSIGWSRTKMQNMTTRKPVSLTRRSR